MFIRRRLITLPSGIIIHNTRCWKGFLKEMNTRHLTHPDKKKPLSETKKIRQRNICSNTILQLPWRLPRGRFPVTLPQTILHPFIVLFSDWYYYTRPLTATRVKIIKPRISTELNNIGCTHFISNFELQTIPRNSVYQAYLIILNLAQQLF